MNDFQAWREGRSGKFVEFGSALQVMTYYHMGRLDGTEHERSKEGSGCGVSGMDWIDSNKTVKVEVVLKDDELHRAVFFARESGLEVLANSHLPKKNEPNYLSTLMCVLRADVSTADVPFQRLDEYLAAFPELEKNFGRQGLFDLTKIRTDLSDTPPPGATLVERLRATRTPPVAGPREDVVDLPVNVAKLLGFSRLHCIGRGGYGVVYLARQDTVSGRVVVIKYTKSQSRETAMLSYLQHPNIMPVWSVHEHENYRVFCMPMHGLCTVADILKDIDSRHELPVSGASFLEYSRTRTNDLRTSPTVTLNALPGKLDDEWLAPMSVATVESEKLTKLNYIDAVVQRFSRLASALQHVHARNIIHLDIKPANILVTADGDFMILDFGLAHHSNYGTLAEACGTARYMAPEQLRQFVHSLPMTPTVSMDLYSLGVVFYELLTGKHPFAESMMKGKTREDWLKARLTGPLPIRQHNPAIPISVATIIHKLLAPLPGDRYQSAEDLSTDLNRHQENLPLKFAANPSWKERFSKFRRRHPVFSVAIMAGLLAGVAISACALAYRKTQDYEQQRIQHQQETAMRQKAEAANLWAQLHSELDSLRMDASSVESSTRRTDALRLIAAWFARYGVSEASGDDWRSQPLYKALDPSGQNSLELAIVELALLAAHAETLDALSTQSDQQEKSLKNAKSWNNLASICLPTVPEVVFRQRDDLARRMGQELQPRPLKIASRSQVDVFCGALLDIANRNIDSARSNLEVLVKENPHHMGAQFTLGWVYHTSGAFASASERYQIVSAVMNQDVRPVLSRARLLCHMQRFVESKAEYTTTLERDPTNGAAHYERANVQFILKDLRAALNDLDAAEKLSAGKYQVLFLRLQIQQQLNMDDAAAATKAEFEQLSPLTSEDFLTRGRSRISTNFLQAIQDFRTATELDQFSTLAWMTLGMAQARVAELQDDAMVSLGKSLELNPNSKEIRAKLGLLLARGGKFKEALKMVDRIEPDTGGQAYSLACVHSLCAEDNEQRQMCVVMLKHARRLGYTKFDKIPEDPDMQNCKRVPEVVKLVKEALAREE